jgi:hypothetical protein
MIESKREERERGGGGGGGVNIFFSFVFFPTIPLTLYRISLELYN